MEAFAGRLGKSPVLLASRSPALAKLSMPDLLRRLVLLHQYGCLTGVPVLRLGIHPEMERFAILNRSMPSTDGATMSNLALLQVRLSSAFQRLSSS